MLIYFAFCFLLRKENCEEGAILVEAEVAGVMGGHKGFIVGPAICHGEDCHRSLQGAGDETLPLRRRRRLYLTLDCPALLLVWDHLPTAVGRADPPV